MFEWQDVFGVFDNVLDPANADGWKELDKVSENPPWEIAYNAGHLVCSTECEDINRCYNSPRVLMSRLREAAHNC